MQVTRDDCFRLHLRCYKRIQNILNTISLSECRRRNRRCIIRVRTRQNLCKECDSYSAELCIECDKNELISNLIDDEDVVAAFLVTYCGEHDKNVSVATFLLDLQLIEFERQLNAIDVREDKDLI